MATSPTTTTTPSLADTLIKDGWFSEAEAMWPGQKFSLKVENVVHKERTEFQDVIIFDSTSYGRVLVLDGVIQLTERDECSYQEPLAHIPLFAHPNPTSVLIVGGGDGGVLREVSRHAGVEAIVMCDIDGRVVELAREFFSSSTATSFTDPRLTLLHKDAALYVKDHPASFDVIIVDSTDPVGPAASLFTTAFYRDMAAGLRPGGVLACQGESMWLHLDLISELLDSCRDVGFKSVAYSTTSVPTYPCGQIGFVLASLDEMDLSHPSRAIPDALQSDLQYYSADMHAASFVLPPFVRRRLESKKTADSAGDVERKEPDVDGKVDA